MAQRIVIVDYGMGNLNSVKRKLDRLKTEAIVSSNADVIRSATKLILPGVGHFKKAMENLERLQLIAVLNERVLEQKIPVLGICLGMQLMCESSEEGHAKGLSWIPGKVIRFQVEDTQKFKIPHMGWNTVAPQNNSPLMKNIHAEAEFYFVHAYHVELEKEEMAINKTDYAYSFVSGFQNGNIYGVQYHPEKSHDAGDQIFQNFIDL
ncbi:MAG: imidazole glycerol phosphate synthase subunit HisH [Crocinitomicaceae bacterium]